MLLQINFHKNIKARLQHPELDKGVYQVIIIIK